MRVDDLQNDVSNALRLFRVASQRGRGQRRFGQGFQVVFGYRRRRQIAKGGTHVAVADELADHRRIARVPDQGR